MNVSKLGSLSYVVARRIAVSVMGGTLLLLGALLLFVPGPGLLVLSMGLGVLALEFTWARRWLRRLRDGAAHAGRSVRSSLGHRVEDERDPPGPTPR